MLYLTALWAPDFGGCDALSQSSDFYFLSRARARQAQLALASQAGAGAEDARQFVPAHRRPPLRWRPERQRLSPPLRECEGGCATVGDLDRPGLKTLEGDAELP